MQYNPARLLQLALPNQFQGLICRSGKYKQAMPKVQAILV
jgi:hypothetical protein